MGWLEWSGIGAFFGLICGWFWAIGSIASHPKYWENGGPKWMKMIAGNPKKYPVVPRRYAYIPPKVLSIIGLFASVIFFHYAVWADLAKSNPVEIVLIETSFPLLFLLTWGMIVMIVERVLKRLPQ